MSSSIIQPVCRRLPSKKRLWDETDLPLSVLLTPLQQQPLEDEKEQQVVTSKQSSSFLLPPISAIPKCLECGAPHPPGMKSSHYALNHSIMCYLCGYESNTTYAEQMEYRQAVEGSDVFRDSKNRTLYHEMKEDRNYRNTSMAEFSIGRRQLAMTCPPIWWIVIDGTSTSTDYWTGISKSLVRTIETATESHIHIGSILVTSTTHVSVWDVSGGNSTNPIPHVEHYLIDDLEMIQLKVVPLTSSNKSMILSTLSALAEAGPTMLLSSMKSNNNNGMKLGSTLEIILNFIQDYKHPGISFLNQEQQQLQDHDDITATTPSTYAGGKITVLLHGPPNEVGRCSSSSADDIVVVGGGGVGIGIPSTMTTSTATTTTTVGRGGVGGAAVEVGHRYSDVLPIPTEEEREQSNSKKKKKKQTTVVMEEDEPDLTSDDDLEMGGVGGSSSSLATSIDKVVAARKRRAAANKNKNKNDDCFIDIPGDLHPEHLNEIYPNRHKNIIDFYENLGCQAGEAALGIDIFCIVEAQDLLHDIPYGIPFLKLLSERSGGTGNPILLRTDQLLESGGDESSGGQLTRELTSRCVPWKEDGMAFGGVLRLRTSPGFEVDPQVMSNVRGLRDCPQLAPSYVQKGLMGVGMTASTTDDNHSSELGLWQLGTLDTHTTVVVDLLMKQRKLKKHGYMEGMGEVMLKSGYQMCLAYTIIVQDENDKQYYTEQRMRVVSLHTPLTTSSEVIYSHLDPEALLVVFYHKLALVAYAGGLEHVQEDAYKWLQSFLSGVYNSAVEYADEYHDQVQQGGGRGRNKSFDELAVFHGSDRTLDEYGNSTSESLNRDEVLLGMGHEAVSPVVLLTWSLMQSDAFRPSIMLSSDARVAAMGQMGTMMASELSRCVAPRLELWIGEERVVENVDLSLSTIQMYLEDLSLGGGGQGGQQQPTNKKKNNNAVLLLDSPAEIIVCHAGVLKKDGITISRPMKPITPSEALKEAVYGYVKSYQVPPKVYYSLDGSPSSAVSIMDRWRDYFLEDSVCALGSVSFHRWKKELAAAVGAENGVLLGE